MHPKLSVRCKNDLGFVLEKEDTDNKKFQLLGAMKKKKTQ